MAITNLSTPSPAGEGWGGVVRGGVSSRNHTFDLLCGICILRMMCNHALSVCGLRGVPVLGITWYDLMSWTFFFMCFFFFKAGYFNKTVSGDSRAYCLDRVKRLLIPYVSWSVVGAIVYFGFMLLFPKEYDAHKMPGFQWSHLWNTAHSYGNGPCWFLMSFFTAYIAIHFIEKLRRRLSRKSDAGSNATDTGSKKGGAALWIYTILILALPFLSYWLHTIGSPLPLSLDNVFMGIFFFILGRLWRIAMQRMGRTVTIVLSSMLILLFVAGNILFHGEYTMSTNVWAGNPWGILVNTVSILCGLSGLLLSLPQRRIPIINYIGQHSMVYFVAHYPLILLYTFAHRAAHSAYRLNWGEAVVLITFILIACTLLVPYVERTPILSGRWKKKTAESFGKS